MKKLLYLLMALLGLVSFTFAGNSNDGGYHDEYVSGLKAEIIPSYPTLKFEWTKAKEDGFKYYKIVHSKTNSNLKYPNDGYVYYTTNVSELSKSVDAKPGYWRICALYKDGTRECSNVMNYELDEVNKSTNKEVNYPEMKLEKEKKNGKLIFHWTKAGDDFKYYKLVYSSDNAQPVYPDDETMFIGDGIDNISFETYSKKGYWRVCALYKGYYDNGNDVKHRVCSNVIRVLDDQEVEEVQEKISYKKYEPQSYGLSEAVRNKLKEKLKVFYIKVEAKYPDIEKQLKIYSIIKQNIRNKKSNITNEVYKNALMFLLSEIEKQEDIIQNNNIDGFVDGLLTIEN